MFELATAPVVVRIVASNALRHRVDKVVRVATWLAEHELPAVRLVPGIGQPVAAGPYLATVWEAVPHGGKRPRGRDLAKLLRRMHELPEPPFVLPAWEPLDDVPAADRRGGRAWTPPTWRSCRTGCDEVADRLAALEFAAAHVAAARRRAPGQPDPEPGRPGALRLRLGEPRARRSGT